jgi:glucan 1,3-beta-glucosidase
MDIGLTPVNEEGFVYKLNILGSKSLVDQDGKNLASYSDNIGVFTNNIAYFSLQ